MGLRYFRASFGQSSNSGFSKAISQGHLAPRTHFGALETSPVPGFPTNLASGFLRSNLKNLK
jgi:hypothetical protein